MAENKSAFPWMSPDDGDPGMSLRDYFAAKAMQAFLGENAAALSQTAREEKCAAIPLCATAAYEVADAMLQARERTPDAD